MELVISCEKNDKELITALNSQFGDSVKYEETKNFDGLEIFLTAVVPITALTVQIVDFILANFCNSDIKSDNSKKRFIVEPDGKMDLRGYTEKEARKIITCYFKNQHDK